jgi:hypothetical protein
MIKDTMFNKLLCEEVKDKMDFVKRSFAIFDRVFFCEVRKNIIFKLEQCLATTRRTC